MKHYGINNPEGSEITNLTVPTGTAFPGTPNAGELFFRTDESKLYSHDGSSWNEVSTNLSNLTPGSALKVGSGGSITESGNFTFVDAGGGIDVLTAVDTPFVAQGDAQVTSTAFLMIAHNNSTNLTVSEYAFEINNNNGSPLFRVRGDGLAIPANGVTLNNNVVEDIGDVTLTSITSGDVLSWNGSGWVNTVQAGANPAIVTFENLDANGDVGTGADQVAVGNHNHTGVYAPLTGSPAVIPDAYISESSVTQHEAALTITESQISDFAGYLPLTGGTVTGEIKVDVVGTGNSTLVAVNDTIGVGMRVVGSAVYWSTMTAAGAGQYNNMIGGIGTQLTYNNVAKLTTSSTGVTFPENISVSGTTQLAKTVGVNFTPNAAHMVTVARTVGDTQSNGVLVYGYGTGALTVGSNIRSEYTSGISNADSNFHITAVTNSETRFSVQGNGLITTSPGSTGVANILVKNSAATAHSFSGLVTADTFGIIQANTNQMLLQGYGQGANAGFNVISHTQSPGSTGALRFQAYKSDGGTNRTTLGTTEYLAVFQNGTSTVMDIRGNGDTTITGLLNTEGLTTYNTEIIAIASFATPTQIINNKYVYEWTAAKPASTSRTITLTAPTYANCRVTFFYNHATTGDGNSAFAEGYFSCNSTTVAWNEIVSNNLTGGGVGTITFVTNNGAKTLTITMPAGDANAGTFSIKVESTAALAGATVA